MIFFADCRDNPSIDCRMYNFNVTCKVDGMYYPWAKVNCPLYCGYCQGKLHWLNKVFFKLLNEI